MTLERFSQLAFLTSLVTAALVLLASTAGMIGYGLSGTYEGIAVSLFLLLITVVTFSPPIIALSSSSGVFAYALATIYNIIIIILAIFIGDIIGDLAANIIFDLIRLQIPTV